MSVSATIGKLRYRTRRRWLPVWRRLSRDGSMALVLLAVALGIGDPLACILHCPLAASVVPAALPGHEHHGHMLASEPDVPTVAPLVIPEVISAQGMACHFLMGGGLADDVSGNMMPQPEHLAAMLALFLAVVIPTDLRRRAAARGPAFQPLERPPDLRPPIAFAF